MHVAESWWGSKLDAIGARRPVIPARPAAAPARQGFKPRTGAHRQVLNAMGMDPGQSWKGPWRWWSEELLLARWDAAAAALSRQRPGGVPRSEAQVRAAGMSLAEFGALAAATGAAARAPALTAAMLASRPHYSLPWRRLQ